MVKRRSLRTTVIEGPTNRVIVLAKIVVVIQIAARLASGKIAAGVVMAKLVVVIQSAARRSQCWQQKIPVLAAVIAVVLIADAAGVRD